jgi:transcriptional regulator with XRE-family HTH domain
MTAVGEYNRNLKIKILDVGISQRELAKKAGIPESHFSMALHGRYNLTVQQQDRVATILGCSTGEIF